MNLQVVVPYPNYHSKNDACYTVALYPKKETEALFVSTYKRIFGGEKQETHPNASIKIRLLRTPLPWKLWRQRESRFPPTRPRARFAGKRWAFFVAALRLSPDAAHPCCRADRGRRRPAGAGAPRPLRRRPAPPAAAPPPSLPCCCTLPDRPCCRAAALSPFPDSGSATPPSKLRCRPFFSSTGAAPPALDSHPCPPRGGAAPLLAPDSLTCLLVRGSLPD